MRCALFAVPLAVAVLSATPFADAHAQQLPWCAIPRTSEVGTPVCAYSSLQQCQANATVCQPSPFLQATPPGEPRGPVARARGRR
jgi:hypothetical protein